MPEVFVSSNEKENGELPQIKVPHGLPEIDKGGVFSAFKAYPHNIRFETKDKDEKIILMLRQHPIVNIPWIIISILIFFCPSLLKIIGFYNLLPVSYQHIATLVFWLVAFTYAIEGFFGWYFNVFFITTKRVMDVDFYNLINRKVTDAELKNIQDVTYLTKGAIGTVFNFGDVMVQTASEIPELIFVNVPSPERVANVLDDLRKPND